MESLHGQWGGAYEISEALGVWRAVRRDNAVTLVATGPGELRDLIEADDARHPVRGGHGRRAPATPIRRP